MDLTGLSLKELEKVIENCSDCPLHLERTKTVPGEGPENASVMFIGEAPGWAEDYQGRPFVGAAGHFLEELLSLVGLRREEVFITNMIKCRPPGNRDPLPKEIQSCGKYLERQIEAINPKIIVALGRYSLARFFPGKSISKIHGTWRKEGGRIYLAMYHPAAALHQQSLRETIIQDFLKLPQAIKEAAQEASPLPHQLSLF